MLRYSAPVLKAGIEELQVSSCGVTMHGPFLSKKTDLMRNRLGVTDSDSMTTAY